MTTPQPPAGSPGSRGNGTPGEPIPGSLEDYFRENRDRVTQDVLTERARTAGHSDAAIEAAWAAAAAPPQPAGGRAIRAILIAYGATFALLSVGMLLNTRDMPGNLMQDPRGGIFVLGLSLGACFVASLVWMNSRRAFWSILSILTALGGLSGLGSSPIWGALLIAGAAAVLWLVWRPAWRDVGTRTDLAVLLVVPLLLLIGIAGTCLASGLPIPGS